jgi:hypothetical protein
MLSQIDHLLAPHVSVSTHWRLWVFKHLNQRGQRTDTRETIFGIVFNQIASVLSHRGLGLLEISVAGARNISLVVIVTLNFRMGGLSKLNGFLNQTIKVVLGILLARLHR